MKYVPSFSLLTWEDIVDKTDWYNISVPRFCKVGGRALLEYYNGSLIKALQSIYPLQDWNLYHASKPHNVLKGKAVYSKNQYLLFQYLQSVSYG